MVIVLPECVFPNCGKRAEHTHHIVYFPEEVTQPLCRLHHEEITILNGQQGRKYRHGLSNKHRWWIWFNWLDGNLKVRRTRKAMEYIAEWDRPRPQPISYSQLQYQPQQSAMLDKVDAPKEQKKRKKKKQATSKKRKR